MQYLNKTQKTLESLYQLPHSDFASEFLISKAELRQCLESDSPFLKAEEVVLACREENSFSIGIYLCDQILADMEAPNLHQEFSMIESVSHYLLWLHKIREDIPLSRLEMEMQAEIDKYIVSMIQENKSHSASTLWKQMDRSFNLASLSSELLALYNEASALAKRYCKYLSSKYLGHNSIDNLLLEVRKFYRQSSQQKFQYIERSC